MRLLKKRALNIDDDNMSFRNKRKICENIMLQDYAHLFKKTKLQNSYINTYKKNRKLIITSLLNNKNIVQYKEVDIINKVKQVAIKARQMASTGVSHVIFVLFILLILPIFFALLAFPLH